MYRRIVTFVFPLVLILAERVMRGFTHSDAERFLAPTVTSVALGLLFPLLAPEDITKKLPERTRESAAGTVTHNEADEAVSDTANVMVYVFTFVWMLFLFLSTRNGAEENPTLYGHPTSLYALAIYFLCVVVVEIKEWV